MWNETVGWSSVLIGVLLGLYMGLKFRSEQWLGGYGALPRRMVRLAHIAFIALGVLNVIAADRLTQSSLTAGPTHVASWALMASAVLMPSCCLAIAGGCTRYEIFVAPVATILTSVILMIGGSI